LPVPKVVPLWTIEFLSYDNSVTELTRENGRGKTKIKQKRFLKDDNFKIPAKNLAPKFEIENGRNL